MMSVHNKTKFEFPEHVREVKKALAASGGERLDFIKKLTETKDKADVDSYKKMWTTLFEEETKHTEEIDNSWVYSFLDDVIEATNLPPYAYLSNGERSKLIAKIKDHTECLKEIYLKYGFDLPLIENDGQFFHGFSSNPGGFIGFDATEESCKEDVEIKKSAKVSVNETLEYFAERAEEEVNEYATEGQQSNKVKPIKFIRRLAERNRKRYSIRNEDSYSEIDEDSYMDGDALNAVLGTAVYAIYGNRYNDKNGTISTLLGRNVTKKKC